MSVHCSLRFLATYAYEAYSNHPPALIKGKAGPSQCKKQSKFRLSMSPNENLRPLEKSVSPPRQGLSSFPRRLHQFGHE